MELISSKTVRFAKVVEACGAPQVVTLWMDPKKDKKLSAAIKANRIMTVIRETVGTKKEFGLVGLHQRPAAIFLLFPKSLSAYANNRVVGIKYDLVGESYVSDPISLKKQSAASGKVQKQPQARAKQPPHARKRRRQRLLKKLMM